MFAGSAKGLGDYEFEDDYKSFFVMKYDFTGEIDYACMEMEEV